MDRPIAEIKDRIRAALDDTRMTQQDLAERTGIPKSSISQYLSGYAKPKQDRIYLIAKATNIDPTWLLGYDVPMRKPAPAPTPAGFVSVPIYGSIHAGNPCGIDDNRDGDMMFPAKFLKNGFEYAALTVHGDSMEPDYKNGDIVLIRITSDFQNGDICSVFINKEDAVLRKVVQMGEGYLLQPLNPKYEPMLFTPDAPGAFTIHGIVSGLFRQ